MKKLLLSALLLVTPMTISNANAADYVIDTEGMHAAINFKVKHVGISWLTGRFDKFSGTYTFDDEKPEDSKLSVDIDVSSVNSNHEKRDAHIREADYLNVEVNPMAHFESTGMEVTGEGTGVIHGELTLNGVKKHLHLATTFVGKGDDPWGGYRTAFEATATIKQEDFDFKFKYGDVHLNLYVEGIRQ
jgi:polyisoprenoid-binding protein YceI